MDLDILVQQPIVQLGDGFPYPAFFGKKDSYVTLMNDPHEFMAVYIRYIISFLQNFYFYNSIDPFTNFQEFKDYTFGEKF